MNIAFAVNRVHNNRMNSGNYIWKHTEWTNWQFDLKRLIGLLAQVHSQQGHLLGRMHDIGMGLRDEAALRVVTEDVLKTSEIEGEHLNPDTVRSSVARRLGVDIGALVPADRHVDGVVEMILDATGRFEEPLTEDRLFGWHASLFPTGYSGINKILTAQWRDDSDGPMQVISGPFGRERVHYEAPPADQLGALTAEFLAWFNSDDDLDPVLKAGIAHLWFVTLHPFEDGNGRIARAVADMALAKADRCPQRFYSLSAQIKLEVDDYYKLLEFTQKGMVDTTGWLEWYLGCLSRAMEKADEALTEVLVKAKFWQHWSGVSMNDRQIKLMNRLLDGFEGKLTTGKWAKIGKCSTDTALRDINDMVSKGVLQKTDAGGRSSSYVLADYAMRISLMDKPY